MLDLPRRLILADLTLLITPFVAILGAMLLFFNFVYRVTRPAPPLRRTVPGLTSCSVPSAVIR